VVSPGVSGSSRLLITNGSGPGMSSAPSSMATEGYSESDSNCFFCATSDHLTPLTRET
jgi:hypothetical protein